MTPDLAANLARLSNAERATLARILRQVAAEADRVAQAGMADLPQWAAVQSQGRVARKMLGEVK